MADNEQERVFLLPGEYHISRRACEIATLLGSCVTVTLKHIDKPCGAMNHFLLDQAAGSAIDKGRYGDVATRTLIWLMQKIDPDTSKYRAGIYGGAAVVSHLMNNAGDIGKRNIEVARLVLREHNIKIVGEDVGGNSGRRIYFNTGTGRVEVRNIRKTAESEQLAQKREKIATRSVRVLIVDDSPLVRAILRQAIESTPGMEVCAEAGDAYEARDMIISEDPDVVSLDIIMPKMDGLKFLRKLSEHYPKPVVICSTIAKEGSDIVERAFEYGAVDVINKDDLQLYKGLDNIRAVYVPKLNKAAHRVVRKIAPQ